MTKQELIAEFTKDEKLYGEEFRDRFLQLIRYEGKADMFAVKIIELMCLYFGSISGQELYDIGCPYEYDPDNKDVLYRALSRQTLLGKFENIRLPHQDNGVRSVYGLTSEGYKKACGFAKRGGVLKTYPLRRTCFHEYALGLAVLSLIRAGFVFDLDTEIVGGLNNLTGKETKNTEGSIRTDAIITMGGKKYYIEQDMGTEKISKLGSKIKYYKDTEKTLIITFHRTENGNSLNVEALKRIRELSQSYDSPEILYQDILKGVIGEKAEVKNTLSTLLLLSPIKTFDAILNYALAASEKIRQFSRQCLLYDFKETRSRNLFNYIMGSNDEKRMALSGMHVYTVNSEFLYRSAAFRESGFSEKIFSKVFGRDEILSYETGTYAHGIYFGEYVRLRKGRAYIEYAQEDVAGLVRVMESFKSVANSNDKLVIVYNTFEFGTYIASFLCDKKNIPGSNILLVGMDDDNVYEARMSKLVTVRRMDD